MKDLVVADAKCTVLEERVEMAQLIQRFVLLGVLERISGVTLLFRSEFYAFSIWNALRF